METPSRHRAEITLPSDTEIRIVRAFDAPRHLVFEVWTKPEYVRLWFGCSAMTVPVCELDFREGGRWRVVLHDPANVQYVCSGEYRTIARPDRLDFTERYEEVPDSEHEVRLTFSERDGVTTQTMRILHETAQRRDNHLKSGMESGLQEMLDRLEQLLASRMEASA